MLVLSRRQDERIICRNRNTGDTIVITAVRLRQFECRLGFSAPAHIEIVREEIDTQPKEVTP